MNERKITVGWYTWPRGFAARTYKRIELGADDADDARITRRSVNPGESMASRQTGRGLWQLVVYPLGRSADLLLAKDGSGKMAVDYRTMMALGFRWKRRWCGATTSRDKNKGFLFFRRRVHHSEQAAENSPPDGFSSRL